MTHELPHISVCVCTYKRPGPLKRLLAALRDQDAGGLFTYSIVVVDNDGSASGRAVADKAGEAIPLTYRVEPRQNIALTRNKCVENAEGDYVAFIDDDEFPTPQWLLTLFRALEESKADGALGPVRPHFDEEPPRWVVEGGFYQRPRYRTGRRLDWHQCRTGNVLLKRRLFTDNPQPFRPEFFAGEDQDFFRRMIEKGCAFVWCDEAVVYEVVPPIRWKRGVLIRRALLRGLSSRRNRRSMLPIVESLLAAPAYAAALPVALVLGQARFMRYAYNASYHMGRLLAVAGVDQITVRYGTDYRSH